MHELRATSKECGSLVIYLLLFQGFNYPLRLLRKIYHLISGNYIIIDT